jgi:hypothetical protein
MKKKITFMFLSPIIWGTLLSQQEIVAGGGYTHEDVGSVSFTIGQSFYKPIENDQFQLSLGIQQVFTVTTVGTINYNPFPISIQVFPNPTMYHLQVQVDGEMQENLAYQITNVQGSQIANGTIEMNELQLDCSHWTSGIYFLQIVKNGKLIQHFKIIKN